MTQVLDRSRRRPLLALAVEHVTERKQFGRLFADFEMVLRDIRIFPIFEGSNDVMRAFIALTGLKPLAAQLEGMADLDLSHRLRSLGSVAAT